MNQLSSKRQEDWLLVFEGENLALLNAAASLLLVRGCLGQYGVHVCDLGGTLGERSNHPS